MDSQRRKVFYLLLLYMFGLSASEGSFEDADKSNDFLSQSHQHFDLRHTIPGEPDKDYPIYSVVPKTSFSCAQKHEGYYADIESRCQAFRICTNTARHTAGFGFLCPNGTLFSQRHFVCDWYRNVRCEESEQFYNKNAHNRISNHYEMMETVRQMIEYPMKTISKALSQKPVHTKTQHPPRSYATQMKTEPQPTVVSFTQTYPSEARHSHQSTTLLSSSMVPTTAKALRGEAVQSLPVTKNTQEIYVNSFGELSTDPGSKFDPKTARIIAKPQKPGRALNFAESINFGLNEYFPAGNRNQKSNKNVGDVSDNFNILRHEIQADLSAKKSVHRSTSNQESSAHSNFISHGFSKNRKNYEKSPNFQFSKPLGSTTKYSNYRTNQKIQQQQQPIVQKQLFKPTPATKSHTFATKPAASNNVFPQDIVIARAEGERIVTTNQTPQTKLNKVSSATNYESLNDFLNKKFGQTQTQAKPTTSYYSTPQQQQQQNNQYNVQQRQQSTHFPINVQQQQQTKHIVYAQPAHHQQIYSQNSIFRTLQQQQQTQQQQQHTYFNNNNQLTLNSQLNNYRQPQPQQQQQIGSYRNLKLPTLNDGIIPAAYTQVAAQRRLDTFNFELETSTLPRMKLFSGVSSYDVPLSSVGRLPNDISQRLRRL